jgi:hypothetical protein
MQEIKDILAALVYFTFFPCVFWWVIRELYRGHLKAKYEDPTVVEKAYNAPARIHTYDRQIEESKNKKIL